MFKPSPHMMARLRLTTKQVGRGYYKGNRTGSMGFFAKPGSYVIDWKKVRTYVAPENLDNFPLTPFVTKAMPPTKSLYYNGRSRPQFQGNNYLDLWATANTEEVNAIEKSIEKQKSEKKRLEEGKKKKQNKKSRRVRESKR
ncbi:50S ribosomal protein YmL27 [Aspergillus sclerotialis]|uniref:50S ribosomal protein YmL27 n=1 Tax=Aspergillus sclerotialis TaxID=2070753 RepID=A0A3A2ZS34_9EURO|nr:50S ribosomal protein YmL27 [Aspergillus sclerotialis]